MSFATFQFRHTKGERLFRFEGTLSQGITGLLAPSGSGKTTLFNLLLGLEKPQQGFLHLNGKLLADDSTWTPTDQRPIACLFQEDRLFPHLTIRQNLHFATRWRKPPPERPPLSIDALAEDMEIEHLLKRRPAKLSGGERRRAALARAILSANSLLLLDEPLTGIEEELRQRLLQLLLRIHESTNLPIFISSHNPQDLHHLTNDIRTIQDGSLAPLQITDTPNPTITQPRQAPATSQGQTPKHHLA